MDFGASKIVRVAQAGGLELKRTGKNIVTRCVFHAENTASMGLSPDRDSYHCFGCGEKGGFVKLADKLNVKLDDVLGPLERTLSVVRPSPEQGRRVQPQRPVEAPKVVEAFRVPELARVTSEADVLAYLQGRHLGAAMERGLLRFPTLRSGPVMETKRGPASVYELGFRFGVPLLDVNGQAAGIQFRRLEEREGAPKFMTFGKGTFGDRRRMATADRVYLAEGLVDYLTLALIADAEGSPVIGFPGTDTVAELLAAAPIAANARVIVALDCDEAGDKAAARAIEIIRGRGALPVRGRMEGLE
jgi:DNA primase